VRGVILFVHEFVARWNHKLLGDIGAGGYPHWWRLKREAALLGK